jgi:hypothetical protein
MGNSSAAVEYTFDDELLAYDVSDEALEAASSIETVPHKTACSSYCPAHSC